MRCEQCGSDEFSSPRKVELTKEIGTIALEARDDRGKGVLVDVRAVVCRGCGTVVFGVPVQGLDWSG